MTQNISLQPGTEAEASQHAGMVMAGPQLLDPGRIYAIANGNGGMSRIDTDEYLDRPRHLNRTVDCMDADALYGYVNSVNPDDAPVELWACVQDRTIVAIMDGGTGWCQHRAELKLQPSPEWLAWSAHSGQLEEQEDFADFLEDHLSNIAAPDGATLLEIVQSMRGTTKATWESTQYLANGQRGLAWVEESETKAGRKGTLEVPSRFTLGLRPFTGSDPFQVEAGLRTRMNAGHLRIGFKLLEPDKILETAFNDVVNQVASLLACDVWNGRP